MIPAHPLALDASRRLDERRQRALTRYYIAAGSGGLAIGVHTTQFEIRDPRHGLHRPVLELASETARVTLARSSRPFAMIAGLVGDTRQATAEAQLARDLGYDVGLLSLGAWRRAPEADIVQHCRAVADVIPLFGFYLQPAVGGMVLSHDFWRAFAEIERVVAIKIAPFDRYRTWDVVRAVAAAGRDDIALYTGNDDSIIVDLLTVYPVQANAKVERRIVGGLLGQWAVWTRKAVEMLDRIRAMHGVQTSPALPASSGFDITLSSTGAGIGEGDVATRAWLRRAAALTDANGAIFDAAHGFAGCIPGIHEVLRRAGLMQGRWCLDPALDLSPGQEAEIARVIAAYPELTDREFVATHRDEWLR